MKEFSTLDTFTLEHVGTVHAVNNPGDLMEPRELTGQTVLLDGKEVSGSRCGN
jgi:hypothetical protein